MGVTGSIKGGSLHGSINRLYELQGYSAYEVAVINGFDGTEEEWLASLRGDKGDPGEVIHTDADQNVLDDVFAKKNPIYNAGTGNILEVIGKAEAGATIALAAGEYPLLQLHGKNAYPENLTIVGGEGVKIAGISITSGVLDSELGGRADNVKAILPRGLTFKNITFTNDFSLRNAAIDDLRFDGCKFRGARIEIAPSYMYDVYGNDYKDPANPINKIRRNQVGLHMKNLAIRKCEIENVNGVDATAVLVKGIDGIYIEDNWIKNIPYNGIQITGMVSADMYNSGVISVSHNQIIDTGNRSIRIAYAKDATLRVCNNILFSANKNSANTDVIKVSECTNSTYLFATNRYENELIDETSGKIVVADCTATYEERFGGNATTVESADSITANGVYDTAVSIQGYVESCIIWHKQHSANYAEQYATSVLGQIEGSILHRVKIQGDWQPWEFINPPMVPGVEYRTTERFNDDPVYCRMVTINDLAANSTQLDLSSYGVKQTGLIRYTGNVWNNNASIIYWMPGNEASLSYKNGAFYLEGHGVNITHYHTTLTLHYIKS